MLHTCQAVLNHLVPRLRKFDSDRTQAHAAGPRTTHTSSRALHTGPVLLADADQKDLLSSELKSGRDLIQTPFGNLPTITEKVLAGLAVRMQQFLLIVV